MPPVQHRLALHTSNVWVGYNEVWVQKLKLGLWCTSPHLNI